MAWYWTGMLSLLGTGLVVAELDMLLLMWLNRR